MVGHAEYMDGATETASGCFLALHSTRGAAASGVRVACVRETILCVYERNEANEQSVEATKKKRIRLQRKEDERMDAFRYIGDVWWKICIYMLVAIRQVCVRVCVRHSKCG